MEKLSDYEVVNNEPLIGFLSDWLDENYGDIDYQQAIDNLSDFELAMLANNLRR